MGCHYYFKIFSLFKSFTLHVIFITFHVMMIFISNTTTAFNSVVIYGMPPTANTSNVKHVSYVPNFFNLYSLPEYQGQGVCYTNDKARDILHSDYMSLIKQFTKHCVYVQGNLVIANIKQNEDLSFLKSIKEISGSLYIIRNKRANISLDSLELIRGETHLDSESSKFSLIVAGNTATNSQQGFLQMPRLKSILQHDVSIHANINLCYMATTINWNDIVEDTSIQRVYVNMSQCTKEKHEEGSRICHANCSRWIETNRSHCWGPLPQECQKPTKCQVRQCTRCYINPNNDNQEECCNGQCVGGCNGATSSDCQACRHYLDYVPTKRIHQCVERCPARYKPRTPGSKELIPNENFRFQYGKMCFFKCPNNYVEDGDNCVLTCVRKNTYEFNGKCLPCNKDQCRTRCWLDHGKAITAASLRKLENATCSILDGNIMINSHSFEGKDPLNWKALQVLKRFVQIDGNLIVQTGNLAPWLTNLTFLENLEVIKAAIYVTKPTMLNDAIYIAGNDFLQFLGLKKLHRLSQGFVSVALNPELCYTSALHLQFGNRLKYADHSEDFAYCESKRAVCHLTCNKSQGCWGPGADMCIQCQHFKAIINSHFICTTNCSTLPGYYYVSPLNSSLIRQTCSRCHHECSLGTPTCTGPGSDQCLTPCANVKDVDSHCRRNCSKASYLVSQSKDARLGVCQRCHSACGMGLSYSLPFTPSVCTGPSSSLSRDGCIFCGNLLVNVTAGHVTCLSKSLITNQSLPLHYFGYFSMLFTVSRQRGVENIERRLSSTSWIESSLKEKLLSSLDYSMQVLRFSSWSDKHYVQLRIFIPCNPLCVTCRDETSICSKCASRRFLDQCVARCPSLSFEDTNDFSSTSLGNKTASKEIQCHPCHSMCDKGCFGQTEFDCFTCKGVRIFFNDTQFYCSDTCPANFPRAVLVRNGSDSYSTCQSVSGFYVLTEWIARATTKYKVIWLSFITVFAVICLILLIIWCLNTHRQRRTKSKRLIEKFHEDLLLLPRDTSSNLSHLLIIPDSQLRRKNEIGRGAFGTVYKGRWIVDESLFMDDEQNCFIKSIPSSPNWQSYRESYPRLSNLSNGEETRIQNPLDSYLHRQRAAKSRMSMALRSTRPRKRFSIPVAIKVLSDTSSPEMIKDLLDEAKVMADVIHPCCLRLLALCMTAQPQLVTQFLPLGNLLNYIRDRKNRLGSRSMLLWARQIASGMAYLETRGIIHRDLAARNVLVESADQVKITDFGLAKCLDRDENEYQSTRGPVPLKWLAIESLHKRKFSHRSDVWAYGVTLWEIFTLGQSPYCGIPKENLIAYLDRGNRLSRPDICSQEVYCIMMRCWFDEPENRPSFKELEKKFAGMCLEPQKYLTNQIGNDFFDELAPNDIEEVQYYWETPDRANDEQSLTIQTNLPFTFPSGSIAADSACQPDMSGSEYYSSVDVNHCSNECRPHRRTSLSHYSLLTDDTDCYSIQSFLPDTNSPCSSNTTATANFMSHFRDKIDPLPEESDECHEEMIQTNEPHATVNQLIQFNEVAPPLPARALSTHNESPRVEEGANVSDIISNKYENNEKDPLKSFSCLFKEDEDGYLVPEQVRNIHIEEVMEEDNSGALLLAPVASQEKGKDNAQLINEMRTFKVNNRREKRKSPRSRLLNVVFKS